VPPIPPELGVPEWLESVIGRALEKEASARFSSAGEMLEALEQEVVVEGRTAVLPVKVSKVPTASSVVGVGVFVTLVLAAGVLALTGQASGQVLGILVLIAGLAAIGGWCRTVQVGDVSRMVEGSGRCWGTGSGIRGSNLDQPVYDGTVCGSNRSSF